MLDLTDINLLLVMGLVIAIVAIAGGVRGVYGVAVASRRERNNQATFYPAADAADEPNRKRRKAA